MRITVQYSAQVRAAAGTAAEHVDAAGGCDLAGLLKLLAEWHGPAFRDLVLDSSGVPRPSNMILVGDEMARGNEPRQLRDGDVVAILSPISGG